MSDAIFLIRDGDLVELVDQPYDSEDLLQRLLADHPSLIAGAQIDRDQPRRWLLVSREMGVPGEEEGGRRWSLDHLYLDQDGIPTLVEVKRGTDTRLRREVVGQMLDYAANAVVHWPVEAIRGRFEARCAEAGLDPEVELGRLLEGAAAEELWSAVKTNLQAGRVRMIFIADVIPQELRRIVEFLNVQMDPAEVLAVEIRQYVGEGLRTLVPRVIGRTAEAERKKVAGTSERRRWDEATSLAALEEHYTPALVPVVLEIVAWGRSRGRIRFGTGSTVSFAFVVPMAGGPERSVFSIYAPGAVEIAFQHMKRWPPFEDERRRRELLARLNAIDGFSLRADRIETRPNTSLGPLVDADRRKRFFEIMDWAVAEIRASGAAA